MIYTATCGETWDTIAYRAYGDEMAFPEIMEANPGLADVIVFRGGEKITIPENLVIDNKIIASPFQTGATVQIVSAPW